MLLEVVVAEKDEWKLLEGGKEKMRAVAPPLAGLLVTVSTWGGPTTASPVGNDVRKVRISHYVLPK